MNLLVRMVSMILESVLRESSRMSRLLHFKNGFSISSSRISSGVKMSKMAAVKIMPLEDRNLRYLVQRSEGISST